MSTLERMILTPVSPTMPQIDYGEFKYSDLFFDKRFPEKAKLEKFFDKRPPLPLREGWKHFDN